MCRFLAYSGEPVLLHDLLYRPEHSIIEQSRASREQDDIVNPDGFGVGWFAPEVSPLPAVFRSLLPAWSNANLKSLSRVIRSGRVFAHVRAASDGIEVSEANCHPFAAGPFLWMHNGTVEGYTEFREWCRHYLSQAVYAQVRGTTDSELVFALFLDLWDQAGGPSEPDGLLDVFRKTLRFLEGILKDLEVKKGSGLNVAFTDGKTTIVSRHGTSADRKPPSLHVARDLRLPADGGKTAPTSVAPGRGPGGVLVASEPLFPDPGWEELPARHAVLVRPDGRVSLESLEG